MCNKSINKLDNIAIVWFRNDLRLHDNEGLNEALLKAKKIIPVYVFDKKMLRYFEGGIDATGKMKKALGIE